MFSGPIPRAMINMEDLNGRLPYFIKDDVGQAGNDKLPGTWDPPHPTSGRQKVKWICGVEQSLGNGHCS